MTYPQAVQLLEKYNKEPFHLHHARVVAGVMAYFARLHDPGREEYWRVVGLLHDIDFEMYPQEHCVKGVEIFKEEGVSDEIAYSCLSHGWGITGSPYEPVHIMEKILFAVDELTGLIGAAALMRPSKSVADMELKSLKKKWKDRKFAAGCNRDTIAHGAAQLGWELDELMQQTINAMKEVEQNG